jgi:hypothetical protein
MLKNQLKIPMISYIKYIDKNLFTLYQDLILKIKEDPSY